MSIDISSAPGVLIAPFHKSFVITRTAVHVVSSYFCSWVIVCLFLFVCLLVGYRNRNKVKYIFCGWRCRCLLYYLIKVGCKVELGGGEGETRLGGGEAERRCKKDG